MAKKILFKLFSIVFLFSGFTIKAQKKNFTIAEATSGLTTTLAPKSIKSPSWEPTTDCFWQVIHKDSIDLWKVTDYTNPKNSNDFIIEKGDFPVSYAIKGLPNIKWLSKDTAWFQNGNDILFGALSEKKWKWFKIITLPHNADNIKVDKSLIVAFTIDNNIWISDKDNGNHPITNDLNKNIINGTSVHRDEFGIDGGLFFSPKSTALAYYCMNQTMVKDYPIINWDTLPSTVELIKYPMAGGTSHIVSLKIFNFQNRNSTNIAIDNTEVDQYVTGVTWSPDERYIYISLLNRDQNHLRLNQYDARTGNFMRTLFDEASSKYIHPTHGLSFLPWKEDEFVFWSERDGYEHLYLYNTEGKLIKQLTKGNWVVNELVGFNKAAKKIIFTASKESPIEKHSYILDVEKGKIERLDKEAGWHNVILSDDGKYLYDVYSAAGVPKNTEIMETVAPFRVSLLKAENPLIDYNRPEIRNINITAADGTTPLYGKLILPVNFDSTKKYPVLVYLYNGPNVQLIHNSFPESGNLWFEYMAQHGFIIFTMDGRGSWNRGLDFEQATFHHLGEVEMEDQLKGVDYLKTLKYVDAQRMGVHGWSFGGFITTSLMLKHPDVFKCAVAGGPVMDWKMYEVMYTERYMGKPSQNPDGYQKANLLDKVQYLKGKLLLIHGTNDDVVVWQHSIDFIKKCVDEGVQVDYFVYPGHKHNVKGKDRTHLMEKISEYFMDNLK